MSISLEVEVVCGCAVGIRVNTKHDREVAGGSKLKFLGHARAAYESCILLLFPFSKQHQRLTRKSCF